MKVSVLRAFARHGVRLTVSFVLLIGVAEVCHAQAAGAAQPTPMAAVPAATPAKTAPGAQAGQPAAPGEHQRGGNHEGIQVHGHWMIEVRNPNGELVSRSEFENGLYTGTNGGATALSAVISGVVTPGSWQVVLGDSTMKNEIVITQPASASQSECSGILSYLGAVGGVGTCSPTLSIAAPQVSGGTITGSTLTFTGSATVPAGFPAALGVVQTQEMGCLPNSSPSACFNASITPYGTLTFTQRLLDSAGTDPAPVPVTSGQTVAVTVVISFASGS